MLRQPSALLLLAAVMFSGCSDDDKSTGGSSSGTPEEVIAAAKTKLDDTSGVKVSLKTDELPDGITAIREATGVGTHPSAFEGDLDLTYQGLPTTAEVIAVDGTTYIKNALLFPDWTEFDPAEFKTPDPATLMEPDAGFSALLSSTTSLKEDDRTRCSANNTDEASVYTGTLPGRGHGRPDPRAPRARSTSSTRSTTTASCAAPSSRARSTARTTASSPTS